MEKEIMAAIRTIRAPRPEDEYDLHALVADALQEHGLEFQHEAPLAPRARIDFLCGSVGIELKRGKPILNKLIAQLNRYAKSGKLTDLIVVCERTIHLPEVLCGVSVHTVSLQSLWGLSLDAAPVLTDTDEPADIPFYDDDIPSGALSGGAEDEISEQSTEPDFMEKLLGEDALSSIPLPAYLQTNDSALHYYGTLSYNARSACWVVKGDMSVTETCKRLFPGTAISKRGEARFSAHRRIIGDLCWLMQRYPLEIARKDRERWQSAVQDAQKDYRRRELIRVTPVLPEIPESMFRGTLKEFQKGGLAFLVMTNRALLADEMGLGKTVQALAALAMLKAFPVLLIVPPHLVRNWQSEAERFLSVESHEPRIHILKGLKPYALPDADIYIVHYLLLRGWKNELQNYAFRAVIFDEVQELRHSGTEKYSAASLLSEKCERVWGLSGTPIYNHGGEIWNVVNVLDYHFLGDFDSFSREWCAGYGNNIVLKPELLGEHLRREGLMLRRTKQEVLPELPEKRRLVQEIDADDVLYRTLMIPVFEKLSRWRYAENLSASERALLEDQISQGERQATGIAKAPFVCQFVRALVENGEKVLLFAHHHAVMDIYRQELKTLHPQFITGRETSQQKEASVDRFMNGKSNLCCISLRAASGLNLQQATCVVFGELDWSPAVHSQAEDRAHRIGQKDSLLCYYLVSPNGSDSDIQDALGLKVSQFLSLMGDAPMSETRRIEDAQIARSHVEHLVLRMDKEC